MQVGPYRGPSAAMQPLPNYPYATLVNATYYPVFRDCLPISPVRTWPAKYMFIKIHWHAPFFNRHPIGSTSILLMSLH